MSYKSPIFLNDDELIKINKYITISGNNTGAIYDKYNKIFKIVDDIILSVHSNKKYKLIEYHFHIPSEHYLNNKRYQSEIHYVFEEYDHSEPHDPVYYDSDDSSDSVYMDLCCNKRIGEKNVLVISNLIKNNIFKSHNLKHMKIKTPKHYYEYDGTSATDGDIPVRWIVDENVIEMNIDEIIPYAKTARPIQDKNGRIILFNDYHHHDDYNNRNYDN
jgi:carbonic anhydrase